MRPENSSIIRPERTVSQPASTIASAPRVFAASIAASETATRFSSFVADFARSAPITENGEHISVGMPAFRARSRANALFVSATTETIL